MKIIEGRISSRFGYRTHPVTGATESYHNGVDIACPIGTKIYAPAAGVVEKVNTHSAGGLQMIVRIGNERYGFAHLSKAVIRPMQAFDRGDVLALTGNSGRTTGPHCHFTHKVGGVWTGGEYIGGEFTDPAPIWEKEIEE